MKQNYDTTLARIAGNIASGILSKTEFEWNRSAEWAFIDDLACLSVLIASAIVKKCRDEQPK